MNARMRQTVAAFGGAAVLLIGIAVPGSAAKDPGPESFQFADRYDCDGSLLMAHVSGSFQQTVTDVPDSDGQAFLADQEVTAVERWNDRGNKQKYTVDVYNHVVEQTGERVADDDPEVVAAAAAQNYEVVGPVFRFTAIQTLQITIHTDDGDEFVAADGTLWVTSLFDSLGDSMPGGFLLAEEITDSDGQFSEPLSECEVADFVAAL